MKNKLIPLMLFPIVSSIFAETINEVNIDDNLTWNESQASVTGTDWSFWLRPNSEGGFFNYEAENGILDISGNAIVGNPNTGSISDKTASINFLGFGNRINFASGKEILIGRVNDGNTGNNFSMNIESSRSDAKNILTADEIYVYGGLNYNGNSASTAQSILAFNGNTVLQANNSLGTDIYLNPKTADYTNIWYGNWGGYNGGTAKFLVSSANNNLNIKDLFMNDTKDSNVSFINSPKSVWEISDAGNHIILDNLYINRSKENASSLIKIAAGNTINVSSDIYAGMEDNLRFEDVFDIATLDLSNGTLFAFKSDASASVSTINGSGGVLNIDAFLFLDFTDVSLEEGFSTSNMLFDGFSSISGSILQNVYLTFDGESYFSLSDGKFSNEIYEFVLNGTNGGLGYTLTIIPEPSAYAAIFSLFALIVLIYRRNK